MVLNVENALCVNFVFQCRQTSADSIFAVKMKIKQILRNLFAKEHYVSSIFTTFTTPISADYIKGIV